MYYYITFYLYPIGSKAQKVNVDLLCLLRRNIYREYWGESGST